VSLNVALLSVGVWHFEGQQFHQNERWYVVRSSVTAHVVTDVCDTYSGLDFDHFRNYTVEDASFYHHHHEVYFR